MIGFMPRDIVGANAHRVCELFGYRLLPGTDHIVIVKETGAHAVCLYQTMFNWRLVTVPLRDISRIDGGWCYTGRSAFFLALNQAQEWPDSDDGSYRPQMWYRDVIRNVDRPEYHFE